MAFSPCGLGSFQGWPISLWLMFWPLGPQTRRTGFIHSLLTNVVRRQKSGQCCCPSHEPQLSITGVQPCWLLLCWQVGSSPSGIVSGRSLSFCTSWLRGPSLIKPARWRDFCQGVSVSSSGRAHQRECLLSPTPTNAGIKSPSGCNLHLKDSNLPSSPWSEHQPRSLLALHSSKQPQERASSA